MGSIGTSTSRTIPPAPAVAGGGGGGAVAGYTRLTPALCVDGYSSGASDNYAGIGSSPLTLTDDGTRTRLEHTSAILTGGYQGVVHRRFTIFWHDTGIDASTVSSIDMQIEHVGIVGGPHYASSKAGYGMCFSTTYSTSHRDTNPPNPEHYISFITHFNSPNINVATMVDEEGTSDAGLNMTNPISRGSIPIYQQNTGEWRGRDAILRRLAATSGINVTNAARDNSTWHGAGKYWSAGETIKVGIVHFQRAPNKTIPAGSAFDFKMHYKINTGRI